MSETQTLDPETSTTDLSATSSTEEEQTSTGVESPSTEQAAVGTETASTETPKPRTPQEIRAALSADPNATVTAGELRTLQQYEQSARDMQAAIEARRGELDTAFTAAESLAISHFETELTNALAKDRDVDFDLLKAKLAPLFATLRDKAEPAAVARFDGRVDQTLLQFYGGDHVAFSEATKGLNLYQKIDLQNQLAYEMGRRAGPAEGTHVLTEAELKERIDAAVLASRNPVRGTSVGGNNANPAPIVDDSAKKRDPNTSVAELAAIRAREKASRGY